MFNCQKCGAQLPEDALFCSLCGTPVAAKLTQKQEEEKAAFSGTYVLEAQGVTVTLTLQQDEQDRISGTLSSTSGMHLQID